MTNTNWCRSCEKIKELSKRNPNLCVSCSDRVEAEIAELEQEDAAVCALAKVADAAGVDCWRNKPTRPHELRLPNDAFIKVVYDAFDQGVTDWTGWAKTHGLVALKKEMKIS